MGRELVSQLKIPSTPGVYCFWNKINNNVYVGSAQDLQVRLNQHFKNKKSNKLLQDEIKEHGIESFHISQVTTETHAEALQLEQMCLDYLFGKDLPKYNMMRKVGGGCVGSKENHRGLCLKGLSKQEYTALSAASGGNINKPYKICSYPERLEVLVAFSTTCLFAQKFLGLEHSAISQLLTRSNVRLFFIKENKVYYIIYSNETLEDKAIRLDRNIQADYKVVKAKLNLPKLLIKKDNKVICLSTYLNLYDAARQVGLVKPSDLSNFALMVKGKRTSAAGWSLLL